MADALPIPTPAPTPIPTPTPAPAPASWTSAISDPELIGYAQNRGLDKLDPAAAFQEAAKAHRNAEKMLGAPADHLLRLPTREDDEAGWRSVYQRLGAPEKAEDYQFEGIDFGDPELTSQFTQAIRETAHELNIPRAMAERLAQRFFKFDADKRAAQKAATAATLQAETQKLAQDWGEPGGDRYRANEFIADQAIKALGVPQDALNKLRNGIGGAEVARLFHKIGLQMGEDKYVAGQNPAQPGMMSVEQAKARRVELMNDKDFVTRYNGGGTKERAEMTALNTLIVGAMR